MKKIFVSVGLAAAGAAGLPSAIAQSVEAPAPAKVWNVSGTLRGFYDDNYQVSHNKQGSFGFEVSPSVQANLALQQTDIGIKYTYGMYYYVDRANHGQNPIDHTHQADLWLDHAFTERLKATASDSFVVAQDPKLVNGGAVTRVGGNNLANRAKAILNADWTRQLSTSTHYGNNLFIYSDSQGTNNAGLFAGSNPSQAALLNRIEQNAGIDLQWHFQPETMGFVGYTFSWVRYTGDQKVSPTPLVGPFAGVNYYSDSRDYNSHYGYVGVQHEFTPSLSGQARGGASYVDLYNDPVSSTTSWAPYADINLTYTYIPGSYVQAGFTQDINATDVAAPGANGHLTQYQQSSVFYMDITHQITSKITGSLVSQYQYSTYKDGQYDGSTGDSDVSVGVNLTYQINRHFSANTGYNYDELFSDIPGRSFTRNRVYLGLSANY